MTPKKFTVALVTWFIWILCMLCGIFTAAAISVYILGGGENGNFEVLQDKSHPAHWAFIALLAPCMLLGAAGGLAAIVLPVYCIFHIPMRKKGRSIGWLDAYMRAVNKMLSDE